MFLPKSPQFGGQIIPPLTPRAVRRLVALPYAPHRSGGTRLKGPGVSYSEESYRNASKQKPLIRLIPTIPVEAMGSMDDPTCQEVSEKISGDDAPCRCPGCSGRSLGSPPHRSALGKTTIHTDDPTRSTLLRGTAFVLHSSSEPRCAMGL